MAMVLFFVSFAILPAKVQKIINYQLSIINYFVSFTLGEDTFARQYKQKK
jgi:hypothetical protein